MTVNSPPAPRAAVPLWLPALLLAAAILIAYLPVVRAGFIWDDDDYVTKNATLRDVDGLWRMWTERGAVPQYYPMVHTTYWLEYQLWELDPLGYHLTNVALHIGCAVSLGFLLARLGVPWPFLVAALFGLHPVHVESVAWITERKNVLSGLFYLLAAHAALRPLRLEGDADGGRERPGEPLWLAAAFVLFGAALLSKTVTCSLPATLLLLCYWKRGRVSLREVTLMGPFFLLGVMLAWVTIDMEHSHVGAQGADFELSVLQRFYIAARAVLFYLQKLLIPFDLAFIYPRWDVALPTTKLLAFVGIVGIQFAIVLGLAWRMGRGALVALLFFGGTLFPALGFINVYPMAFTFVADHYQYLASIGVLALVVVGLHCAHTRLSAGSARAVQAGIGIVLVLLAFLTARQTLIYRDVETLWRDTVVKNPTSFLALSNLGFELMRQGRNEEAVPFMEQVVALRPDEALAHYNLATALAHSGREKEAEPVFRRSAELNPDSPDTHANLAATLMRLKKYKAAIASYENTLKITGDHPGMLHALGRACAADKQYARAVQMYELARNEGEPCPPGLFVDLGLVLQASLKKDEAAAAYWKALELEPGNSLAANNLANVLVSLGKPLEAIPLYERVLGENPDDTDAHYNLATVLLGQGRAAEAAKHLEIVVRQDPKDATAKQRLELARQQAAAQNP